MKKKFFLSHSSEDKVFVEKLGKDLERLGVTVWYSGWEIRVGDSIVEKIDKAIGEMAGLVIVLSNASVHSRWVREEFNAALTRHLEEKEIGIFPARIDDCEVPPLLRHRRYADFSRNPDALSDLVEAIMPIQSLLESIKEIKTRFLRVLEGLRDTPEEHEDWAQLFGEVNALLEEAVEARYRIELRSDSLNEASQRKFFEQFDYLARRGWNLRKPEWAWVVQIRNLLAHEVNNTLGVLPAWRAMAKRSEYPEREERVEEILAQLEAVFDILLEVPAE